MTTTPVQHVKAAKPSTLPGRTGNNTTVSCVVEVKLEGSLSQVDTDYAAIVAIGYTATGVTISMH